MEISLSHARCEKIKQIIVDLFVQYDIRCIPVSAFEVATKMGVPVIPYAYECYQKWLAFGGKIIPIMNYDCFGFLTRQYNKNSTEGTDAL